MAYMLIGNHPSNQPKILQAATREEAMKEMLAVCTKSSMSGSVWLCEVSAIDRFVLKSERVMSLSPYPQRPMLAPDGSPLPSKPVKPEKADTVETYAPSAVDEFVEG
jgi:hypothetical protein